MFLIIRVFLFYTMKLFITNKKRFEEELNQRNFSNGFYKTFSKIHQDLFNELLISISDEKIPIYLYLEYKTGWYVTFKFKSINKDMYFYEFIPTEL